MFAHGIMFHHFHNEDHPSGQGSISAKELAQMIDHVGPKRILTAQEWLVRHREGKLKERDLCITFDDNLLCQFDIAKPVLEAYNLTGFWFVLTSVMRGKIERLEVYRYFRSTVYDDVDSFYKEFFEVVDSQLSVKEKTRLGEYDIESYLKEYKMYSFLDRKFRLVRDLILGVDRYNKVMDSIMERNDFHPAMVADRLWMNDSCIQSLERKGHIVGLHSDTHPTNLSALEINEQRREYSDNIEHLLKVIGSKPTTMSHPCNSYHEGTLGVLKELGIEMGFRANMDVLPLHGSLEIPRINHIDIIKEMRGLSK